MSEHVLAARFASLLHSQLTPSEALARRQAGWYLAACLVFAALCGLSFTRGAFRTATVAALDTHQHVYWMYRFLDPSLFPGDPHTDYFQAVAPWGYAQLYHALTLLGADPLVVSKLLPTALALAGAYFCFQLTLRLFPVPAAAFASAMLMTQYAWMHADLTTGTPRAFLYPVLAAFLERLVARDGRSLALATIAGALFYPQVVLMQLAVLAVWPWRWAGGPRLAASRRELLAYGTAAALAAGGLLLYATQTAPFGPVVTPAEARTMAEFGPKGFRAHFVTNPWEFWLFSFATGYWHALRGWQLPAFMAAGFLLPLLWPWWRRQGLAADLAPVLGVLARVIAAATGLYILAHAFLFWLYLPGRYTSTPLALAAAIAAGVGLVAGAGRLVGRTSPAGDRDTATSAGTAKTAIAAALVVAFLAAPLVQPRLPLIGVLREGPSPALYAFLAGQPKAVQIASLSAETEFIPMFARRKVLVANTVNPYHLGYYRPVGQAFRDLIAAQYSGDLAEVAGLLERHRVDLLVLDREAFEPSYLKSNMWLAQFQAQREAIGARMRHGVRFALDDPDPRWIAFETPRLLVLRADAIRASAAASAAPGRRAT